jgi:hypothetical protein
MVEAKKALKDLPPIEEDPRYLSLVKDYKCKTIFVDLRSG